MSTALVENEPSIVAEIITALSTGVLVEPSRNDLSMEISFPDFARSFRFELTDFDDSEIESGRVFVRAAIDPTATMVLTLLGVSDNEGFHTRQFSFGFESVEKTAESDFRLSTLRATLSLANKTRLVAPGLGLDHWFRLNENLRDISEMLKLRQTMFRLMVIERATGGRFKVPAFIQGEDMEAIAFLYHSIVERSFGWPFEGTLTVSYEASKDLADNLETVNDSPDFSYPLSQHKLLFGMEVSLGLVGITIINKDIENLEEILRELRMDDGHTVAVKVRSRIGLAHYNVRDAPRLPAKVWNDDLRMLIDMEFQLDAALVKRYDDLAAASLAGLNEDEKAQITMRSTIGEAFLVDDMSTERV
jgi:hypothetical protein